MVIKYTDRQTDKFFDTIYRVYGFFLSVKFATSLLALFARGILFYSQKLITIIQF